MEKKDTSNNHQVLAIIPARGGSKGLPRKNIRDLCGKPLVAYSIEAAKQARNISRVVVSTEDKEIASTSEQFGAEVPCLRPHQIAGDNALVRDAVQHMAQTLEKDDYHPDAIVTLFPTHPFRTPELIEHLVSLLFKGYTSVYTGKPLSWHQSLVFVEKPGGIITMVDSEVDTVSIQKRFYYKRSGLFMASLTGVDIHRSPYLHMLKDPICWIDIDYLEDFLFAKKIIEKGLFDFHSRCIR